MAAFIGNVFFFRGSCLCSKDVGGSRNNDGRHLFPALVSLGIHGLVASLFIPSFLKPCVQTGTPVEVVWEARQVKPALIPDLESRTTTNSSVFLAQAGSQENIVVKPCANKQKIVQATHSTERCKKIRFIPPVVQASSSGSENLEKGSQKQLAATAVAAVGFQRRAHQPLPKYPWISRKRGQEGVVALIVKTNEEGQVIEANLHKSSGHTPLDESALETVKSWVLAEGSVERTFSIAFRLKDLEGKLEESV